ncbi:MAG: hypothetical protein L6Q81_02145 [Bacteroidia bacterium]|nr:hypothetical protein [Bacteroidia bacterium]
MNRLFIIFGLILLATTTRLNAQQAVQLDSNATFGTWSSWTADTVKGSDGTLYTWEYRYTATKRKGIAVYYDFEVKNTGSAKLSGSIQFSYYDYFVKGNFSGNEGFKVKPGETTTVSFIQQGCKKKDKKRDDYKACFDCPLQYKFIITTK